MQILAIDFGLKKVGLAIGNTLTKTSMPISTIFYKSKQELFNLLEKHVIEWKPEFIIIGNPLNMDQTESEMSKLAEISFEKFYKDFTQTIVNMPDMKSKQRYSALRPSDKEIIARDAFRRTLYSHSRDLFGQLTSSVPTIAEEKASPPPTSQNTRPIGFEDSVSQAPSEVISIRQSSDERISNSILKLHIENDEQDEIKAGGQENMHEVVVPSHNESKRSYKKIPSIVSRKSKNDPYFFSAVSRKSRMTNKSEDVINIDIASSTNVRSAKGGRSTTGIRSTKGVRSSTKESVTSRKTNRSKSHFSRSPKVEPAPCFFDEDDGINVKDADVATFV